MDNIRRKLVYNKQNAENGNTRLTDKQKKRIATKRALQRGKAPRRAG